MKKTKKLLAVILAISMIAVMFVALPVSAATLTDAQKLEAMNLFRGDVVGAGLTAEYLAKTPDRKTAARLLLRFTGLEEAADAYTGVVTFSDATTATVYWQKMIGYLKANPSAGFGGYEDGTFRPNDAMTAQAFYKVLLTILGYRQDVDFTWANTLTFAATKGLTRIANDTSLNNNDVAIAMVEALNANTKTGKKLILELVEDGVVTAISATAAGFNVISSITGYNSTGYTMVYQGTNPLPTTVTAVYSDGTTASAGVTWSAFSTTVEGTYDVTGTVTGFGTITTKVTLTKTLVVTDAYPSGIKEITVTFNMAVPTATAVTCKFGAAVLQNLTQTWSTDRKTLKITRSYNFTAGTYSVTAATSTKEFLIENEKLTQISIGATTIYPQEATQDLDVTFYNQYGTAMNPLVMNLTLSALCTSQGGIAFTMGKTATSITISGADVDTLTVGNTVTIIVIDGSTGQAATKVVTVAAAPMISSFFFGTMTIASSATKILIGTSGHVLTVLAYDQYGNAYKLRTGNQDISTSISISTPLYITSTNSSIVNAALIEVDSNGSLFFKPGCIGSTGGTATLTVMSPMNGTMASAAYAITVYEPAAISTLNIQGVSGTMYAGQWTPLIAYAYDQYGVFVALTELNTPANLAKVTMISSNTTAVPAGSAGTSVGIRYNTTTRILEVYGAAAGVSTVMISYNNVLQATMQLTVSAAAAPSQISAVSMPVIFQRTAASTLTLDSYAIFDQYGSAIALQAGYTINIVATGMTVSQANVTTINSSTIITALNTAGNYVVTFTLKDASNNTLSSRSVDVQVIETSSISSFQFDAIGIMYSKATGNADYRKLINITGRTATGIPVQLVYIPATGLPDGISNVTSSNSSFTTVVVGGRLYLDANYTGTAYSSLSTVLKAFSGTGTELASTTATASTVSPYMYTVYFTKATETLVGTGTYSFSTYLVAKNQYGVSFPLSGSDMVYMTTNASAVTVDNTLDTFTLVAPGQSTVKAYFPASDITREMVVNVQ